MEVEDSASVSQMKRYRSDPALFKNPNVPQNKKLDCPQDDDSNPQPASTSLPTRPRVLGRRFSTSQVHLTPSNIMKIPSRLTQIKLEETIDKSDIETAREREVQSSIGMSHSWEELSLDESESMLVDSMPGAKKTPPPPLSYEPLFISTCLLSNIQMSAQSPTRVGKQCYSPSLQQPIRDSSFISMSPNCTNLSPIMFRPSPLCAAKRKHDMVENACNYISPAKKFMSSPSFSSSSSSSSSSYATSSSSSSSSSPPQVSSSSSLSTSTNLKDSAISSDEPMTSSPPPFLSSSSSSDESSIFPTYSSSVSSSFPGCTTFAPITPSLSSPPSSTSSSLSPPQLSSTSSSSSPPPLSSSFMSSSSSSSLLTLTAPTPVYSHHQVMQFNGPPNLAPNNPTLLHPLSDSTSGSSSSSSSSR